MKKIMKKIKNFGKKKEKKEILKEIKSEDIMKKEKKLKSIEKAFKKDNPRKLRKISNQITEKAMITREKELIEMSIIAYALSKILRKPHYREEPGWNEFKEKIQKELEENTKKKREMLENIKKIIKEFNEEAGNYIEGVIDHGRKKQASRLYSLGLSLKSSVEITGTSQEKLLPYLGATRIPEKEHTLTIPIEKRYQKSKNIIKEKRREK